MDVARIFVAIAAYNRRRLAELCIPTVRDGMKHGEDALVLYDDGSTEPMHDSSIIVSECDGIVSCESMGIDAQRRKHILEFWGNREIHGCSHLYLCDADAPHDILWRETALALQAEYKAPVCLYRTQTHADYVNNIFRDEPSERVIWQRFSPGVSLLLDMQMVERVAKHMPETWAWDWAIAGMLGHKMAVSRMSLCDHISRGGLHHDGSDGYDGGDRATNPTPWLEEKRREIVSCLTTS